MHEEDTDTEPCGLCQRSAMTHDDGFCTRSAQRLERHTRRGETGPY